jgi:uncharacterized protein
MISYTTNQYGLREKDMQYMYRLFESVPEIEKVIIYGSRSTGKFEKGSDVDLAVHGNDVTYSQIAHVHNLLETESPTLLWFDVLHYETLANENLKKRIMEDGTVIYERK